MRTLFKNFKLSIFWNGTKVSVIDFTLYSFYCNSPLTFLVTCSLLSNRKRASASQDGNHSQEGGSKRGKNISVSRPWHRGITYWDSASKVIYSARKRKMFAPVLEKITVNDFHFFSSNRSVGWAAYMGKYQHFRGNKMHLRDGWMVRAFLKLLEPPDSRRQQHKSMWLTWFPEAQTKNGLLERLIRELEIEDESLEKVYDLLCRSGLTLREIRDTTLQSYNQIWAIIALFINRYEL